MQFKYNYFYCLAFSHRKTWHGRPLVVLDTRRVDIFHIRKWWISDWWWQVYKITPGKWKMWEHPRVLMVRHTYTWVKLSSHTDAGSQVNRVKLGFCFVVFFFWRVSVLKYLRHKLTFECYMTEVVIIIFWVYFFFKHRVFNQDFLQNKSMKNKWIRCWLYFFCSILTFRADTKKKLAAMATQTALSPTPDRLCTHKPPPHQINVHSTLPLLKSYATGARTSS